MPPLSTIESSCSHISESAVRARVQFHVGVQGFCDTLDPERLIGEYAGQQTVKIVSSSAGSSWIGSALLESWANLQRDSFPTVRFGLVRQVALGVALRDTYHEVPLPLLWFTEKARRYRVASRSSLDHLLLSMP
jgi:hypothetical protein